MRIFFNIQFTAINRESFKLKKFANFLCTLYNRFASKSDMNERYFQKLFKMSIKNYTRRANDISFDRALASMNPTVTSQAIVFPMVNLSAKKILKRAENAATNKSGGSRILQCVRKSPSAQTESPV